MQLQQITIENFRSIERITFVPEKINESYTYTLLGINESGKSSFLKGISLYDSSDITYPIDYFDRSKEVIIEFKYAIETADIVEFKKEITSKFTIPDEILNSIFISDITIRRGFPASTANTPTVSELFKLKTQKFANFFLNGNAIQSKTANDSTVLDFDLRQFIAEYFPNYFWNNSQQVVFWKSTPEYLILDEIDLTTFANNPEKTSKPLLNCFLLAGFKKDNLVKEIEQLSNPVNRQSLEDKLSDHVTNHINNIWPAHPITIKFNINNNRLAFLIEDNDVKYSPKVTSQRSDGFRQFLSFLLTLSVENKKKELYHTILLIDEPETHLHPQAQLNLKNELIQITENNTNNIVFYATHSNYMVDKDNINRCFKVEKEKNHKTKLHKIESKNTSYSEVNYEIFDIVTSDYHNELYGFIELWDNSKL